MVSAETGRCADAGAPSVGAGERAVLVGFRQGDMVDDPELLEWELEVRELLRA